VEQMRLSFATYVAKMCAEMADIRQRAWTWVGFNHELDWVGSGRVYKMDPCPCLTDCNNLSILYTETTEFTVV